MSKKTDEANNNKDKEAAVDSGSPTKNGASGLKAKGRKGRDIGTNGIGKLMTGHVKVIKKGDYDKLKKGAGAHDKSAAQDKSFAATKPEAARKGQDENSPFAVFGVSPAKRPDSVDDKPLTESVTKAGKASEKLVASVVKDDSASIKSAGAKSRMVDEKTVDSKALDTNTAEKKIEAEAKVSDAKAMETDGSKQYTEPEKAQKVSAEKHVNVEKPEAQPKGEAKDGEEKGVSAKKQERTAKDEKVEIIPSGVQKKQGVLYDAPLKSRAAKLFGSKVLSVKTGIIDVPKTVKRGKASSSMKAGDPCTEAKQGDDARYSSKSSSKRETFASNEGKPGLADDMKNISLDKNLKPPKSQKSTGRFLRDQGIVQSAYTGERIRAQRGDYIGPNSDKAEFERRPKFSRDNRRRGPKTSDASKGGGYGDRGKKSFVPDKDADEKPRFQQRSGRRNSSKQSFASDAPIFGKGKESRRSQDRFSKDRNRRDNDIFRDMDKDEKEFAFNLLKKNGPRNKKSKQQTPKKTDAPTKQETIIVFDGITVKEFAKALAKPVKDVMTTLMDLGINATINNKLDFDACQMTAEILDCKVERDTSDDLRVLYDDEEDSPEDMESRPPIVCVMGHVDHGKTSVLDYIRNAQVTSGEAGGITQSLGAYTAKVNSRSITFIDTPGHEAFTAMRSRGAKVTDLAILVIAVDDGVKPQTVEAINHAIDANTKIVVAINKIDKLDGDAGKIAKAVDRIKAELSELMPEINVYTDLTIQTVSAKTGEGIEDLLEMLLLEADMLELMANPDRNAVGTVLESSLTIEKGPVANVLVRKGTLKKGAFVAAGSAFGRVRALTNDRSKKVPSAGPSEPIEIIGFSKVPEAGQTLIEFTSLPKARAYAEKFALKLREKENQHEAITLANFAETLKDAEKKELKLIVKADSDGSIEALRKDLLKLSDDEVSVKIIHSAVGGITETDITLAKNSKAIVIGFNVNAPSEVRKTANSMGVDINLYDVIYDVNDAVERAIKGMAAPVFKEVIYGSAEVREIFKAASVGTIAGCYVLDGKILRRGKLRLIRNGRVIYTGEPAALKRFKDDVREVQKGFECGLSIKNYNDIKKDDIIESFGEEEEKEDDQ